MYAIRSYYAAVLPAMVVSAEETVKVSSGLRIPKREDPQPEDSTLVRAYNEEGLFIGIRNNFV